MQNIEYYKSSTRTVYTQYQTSVGTNKNITPPHTYVCETIHDSHHTYTLVPSLIKAPCTSFAQCYLCCYRIYVQRAVQRVVQRLTQRLCIG